MTQGWLSAGEAAQRLGVKPATLYAYVSRGVLARRRGTDGRSRFDPAEVEALARRGRPRRALGPSEVVVESAVTRLAEDRPFFRGHDAVALAASAELEEVAELLWTGQLPSRRSVWRPAPGAVAAGRAAQAGLAPEVLPLERLQVIVPVIGASDPLRHNLDPGAVVAAGRQMVAGMVECLPARRSQPSARARDGAERGDDSIAARLWTRLTAGEPRLRDALRTALVLLADHELAASTLAARVAASVRADPYSAVLAGLGAQSGTLHGGAALAAENMLAEASTPDEIGPVLGRWLRRGDRVPGFGHWVYRDTDLRAVTVLDSIRAAVPSTGRPAQRLAVAESALAEARRRHLPGPNVEFALAALADVAGMISGAGEAIFSIARTVGLLAHAMEEYAAPTPLRLRAVYIGP